MAVGAPGRDAGCMNTAVAIRDAIERDDVTRVLTWRFGQLARAGFEPETATVLAARFDVDLHEALDLVGRGCPPETAARILL
jgi:hypothetical protein